MALPQFFSRVADSLRPVAEADPQVLEAKLGNTVVHLRLDSNDPGSRVAYDLAANLCARLYPRIELWAPAEAAERAQLTILSINPSAETTIRTDDQPLTRSEGVAVAQLHIGRQHQRPLAEDSTATPDTVTVDAHGWDTLVDPPSTETATDPGHRLTWLIAAALGASELFRIVFANELGDRGRRGPQPGGFNILSHAPHPTQPTAGTPKGTEPATSNDLPAPNDTLNLGTVHLIGAGAIGQAAAYALLHATDATGHLVVVDPETVTLSNLQRYLLTDADAVGQEKTTLLKDAFQPTRIAIEPQTSRWGDREDHLQADQVLVALDTARDRLTVAGTLPNHAYNAWTQVADLGWSRHEHFGVDPCLACLYYPNRPRPSDHELISEALHQPPLRVLAYLTLNIPVGFPLPGLPVLAELTPQPGDERWLQVPLLQDLVALGVVNDEEAAEWSNKTIGALYRDGICAGGLLPVGDLPGDVLVPLAHQSALAGFMLATELIAARDPNLKSSRTRAIEHRYDVLRGFPQMLARPRQPTPGCICSDPVYRRASRRP